MLTGKLKQMAAEFQANGYDSFFISFAQNPDQQVLKVYPACSQCKTFFDSDTSVNQHDNNCAHAHFVKALWTKRKN